MSEDKTKGVETLLGNPRKAVLAMSVPLIIAMIAQSANNLIDAVWVAGLGPDALAAVGFVFPLFFILIGVGNGIGIGASSAIARHIGRDDKASVDRVAMQSIVMIIIGGAVGTALMLVFQRDILVLLGSGQTIGLCVQYGTPIFIGTILFFLNGLFSNLLRSEGAAKRSMMTQILAAVINIILDPFFIYDYGLGLGMAGAAWATFVSVTFSFVIMLYWFLIKKDTYIKLRIKDARLDKATVKDVLRVGIPSSLEMFVMSIFSMFMNIIMSMSPNGTDAVAIFSSTWRLIQMLMIPVMAIGSAVVPVFGAAFGARRFDKMNEAYSFSIKTCVIIMIVLDAITLLAADVMVMMYTYSDSVAVLKDSMAETLRVLCLFLPFMSWGFVAAGLFQSMGLGTYSFICTIIRNGLQLPAGYILVTTVGTFISVVWGIVGAEIVGSVIGGVWSLILLKSLLKKIGGISAERPAQLQGE